MKPSDEDAAVDTAGPSPKSPFLRAGDSGPPRELSIYYLRGLARDAALWERSDYLGNWQEGGCSFLFFRAPAGQAVRELLREQPELELIQEHRVAYSDWLGGEIAAYTEGRIRVVPAWERPAPDPDFLEVRLDPGVVFGAGNHPTTRGCLRELDRLIDPDAGQTVLDLGSGTGLLSIAAARLGASRVLGVDANPLAARTMRANILRNDLRDRVLAACGLAESAVTGRADIVLANIHYDVMIQVASRSDIVRAGHAVLAGLFPAQAEEIASVLRDRGMHVRVMDGLEREWPIVLARGRTEPEAKGQSPRTGTG